MGRLLKWGLGVLVVAGVSIGAFALLTGPGGPLAATISAQTPDLMQTVAIRAADSMLGQISASGSVAPVDVEHVVMGVDGTVLEVVVEPGDVVAAGDALLRLDTSDLELSVLMAELDVATAENTLAQLQKPAGETEIAEARADLLSAQEKLADARAPASAMEIQAAQASVAAAWAKYNDLKAGPSDAELTKLEANLRKTEIALQEAQRAYDKVKWANDAGMTAEGAKLQQATIDYEAAKADYEVSVAPADEADLQSAISQAKDAQQKLDDLLDRPNPVDSAAAEAQVAGAQTRLDNLLDGADDLDIEASTIKLQTALVTLGEARKELAKAVIASPVTGSILTVATQEGNQERSGAQVATVADLGALELTVNVAEVDVNKIATGQAADVSVDALPGRQFAGQVTRIAPVNSGAVGSVSYAVTIALAGDLAGLLPDMTAVARFVDESISGGWLVPTASIQGEGNAATVPVVRDGMTTQAPVTTGPVQGEWTVVYSAALRSGDQVAGTVYAPSAASQDEAASGGGVFRPRPPEGFGEN